MIQPDRQTAIALLEIQKHSQWPIIRKWLDNSVQKLYKNNIVAQDMVLYWNQGQLQALNNIINTLDNAKKLIGLLKE